MTEQKKKTEPAKSADFIDLITGRIGKITALVAAVGVLVLMILNKSDLILSKSEQVLGKLAALGLYTRAPCVQVDAFIIPATVKYKEWENMTIKINGHNNCSITLDGYVTFDRRTETGPWLIRFRLPHEELPECRRQALQVPLQEPTSWDAMIPIWIGKGNWHWDLRAPPIEPMSDPRRVEKIAITWRLHNYDTPTNNPIWVRDSVTEVQNDAGDAR
jgi:hypothetical protein